MRKIGSNVLWMIVSALSLSFLAACSDPSDDNDVDDLVKRGDNVFKVGSVSTPIGECLDGYMESDGGVTHFLHFYTKGYYHMNGDGTCSVNSSFSKTGAYVEIPAFDKGQSELFRLTTGSYFSKYSSSDDWSGEYIVTKGGSSTKSLSYDKMTELQISTVDVRKKGDIYEITWDGSDEKGNPCSLYYYGSIHSEAMRK